MPGKKEETCSIFVLPGVFSFQVGFPGGTSARAGPGASPMCQVTSPVALKHWHDCTVLAFPESPCSNSCQSLHSELYSGISFQIYE